jgi:DNA recombination protein RmuC
MNSSDAESAGDALLRHHKSITAHVDELAKRDNAKYLKKSGRETIDFVIMFIPNEASYLLALKNHPLLWQEAFARKVVIVSPLHLMTLLQLIHISWTKSEQDRNQLEILKNAGQMLDRLYAFYHDFDEIGQRMEKLQESYGNALKRLKQTPNGHSIVSTGEKLKKLGVKLSKERPLPSRLEVETEVFPLPGLENSSGISQEE